VDDLFHLTFHRRRPSQHGTKKRDLLRFDQHWLGRQCHPVCAHPMVSPHRSPRYRSMQPRIGFDLTNPHSACL
jgi:hypothetical protein